ncbi:MAG: SH3 domain-containing protein [Nodosilinea sp.]
MQLGRRLGLGLMLTLGVLSSCSRSPEGGRTAEGAAAEKLNRPVAGEALGEAETEPVDDGGFRSTPVRPARTAYLKTQAEESQVNLRSQPTTESAAQSYGLGGDRVTLLHLAEGEGGFSWYYISAQSEAEGWVRGDFIDTTSQAALVPGASAVGALAGDAGSCGSTRPKAFFETKSFTVHLCQSSRGLSYIGINKTSNDTLTTADVLQDQDTYVAISGNYQYHINDKTLAVYEINSGSYNQLENETVIRHEQFVN